MSDVIFYNSSNLFKDDAIKDAAGIELFKSIFTVFGSGVSFLDRTGIVVNPINCHILPFLKVPAVVKPKEFDEICDSRAKHLLTQAAFTGRKIAVMYSGGVDSTLILAALYKVATKEELKLVTVLLSEDSIRENPRFYSDYVVKYFNCAPSYNFQYYVGNNSYLLVSGEHGDQLFGSALTAEFKPEQLYSELNRDTVVSFIEARGVKQADKLFDILNSICIAAPVKINTLYQFLWWINFATKWQNVYTRMLPHALKLKEVRFQHNYTTFFGTDDFQQWSMGNCNKFGTTDKVLKDEAKRYICAVTKDVEFMTKPKIGSLSNLIIRSSRPCFIDRELNAVYDCSDINLINPVNSFV